MNRFFLNKEINKDEQIIIEGDNFHHCIIVLKHKVGDNILVFDKKEDELKKEELKIISQRNILKNNEIEEKLKKLQNEANTYRTEKAQKINEFNKKKINATEQLFKSIEPILIDYSNKNSISIFLQKKNIVIGKSELNKTSEILKIVNLIGEGMTPKP